MADDWIPEARNRLAQRRAKKPDTKAGQIWALWAEIRAALDDGQGFRSICDWLADDAGITVSIPGLRSYVSRSRRKESVLRKTQAEDAFLRAALSAEKETPRTGARKAKPADRQVPMTGSFGQPVDEADPPANPIAGAIRALDKARRRDIRDIHGDGDPSGKNLI